MSAAGTAAAPRSALARRPLLRWLVVTVITTGLLLAHLLTDHDTAPAHPAPAVAVVALDDTSAAAELTVPAAALQSASSVPSGAGSAATVMAPTTSAPLTPDWHVVAAACVLALAMLSLVWTAMRPQLRRMEGARAPSSGPLRSTPPARQSGSINAVDVASCPGLLRV